MGGSEEGHSLVGLGLVLLRLGGGKAHSPRQTVLHPLSKYKCQHDLGSREVALIRQRRLHEY